MTRPVSIRSISILGFCLIALTLAVYWQVRGFDFLLYDEIGYITENPMVQRGFTADSLRWAFTTTHQDNWHPLTWLSHMLDCELFGLNPKGHHLTNLAMHVANVWLLLLVLCRMTGSLWRSVFVAGVFALHPLHVESVAWVAERKDVLSTLFWFSSLSAYVAFVVKRKAWLYGATLLLFALGLMAKPMLVTFPLTLLLWDYWPLHRISGVGGGYWRSARSLLLEKIPFLILSASSCALTYFAQEQGGAVATLQRFPLSHRVGHAVLAYSGYLGKALWPRDLSAFYPYPGARFNGASLAVATLALMVVSIGAFRVGRRYPYLPVGWLFFLGTLVPVIGLVQVGEQAAADRYMYVPIIGISIMVAWGIPEGLFYLMRRAKTARGIENAERLLKATLLFAGGCTLVLLAVTARIQASYWRTSISLWGRAVEVTEKNYVAQNNLGLALAKERRFEEAIVHYQEAQRVRPNFRHSYANMGLALFELGRIDEAVAHYRIALRLDSGNAALHTNLGAALARQGKFDEAVQEYTEALRITPDAAKTHSNLGASLARLGRTSQAIRHFTEAVRIEPGLVEARYNLALALEAEGSEEAAAAQYRETERLQAGFVNASIRLAALLSRQGKTEEAIRRYRFVVQKKRDTLEALNDLAWILATTDRPQLRNGAEALDLAQRACELTAYQNPNFLDTLAAAYAEARRLPEAVRTAEKALEAARSANQTELAENIKARMKLYQSGRAYQESASGVIR